MKDERKKKEKLKNKRMTSRVKEKRFRKNKMKK